MNIIIFDTETTGLLLPEPADIKKQPYIIEFYGCKINENFDFLEEFETLIKPPIPISQEITKITKIEDKHVAGKPVFPLIFKDLAKFFTGVDILVAHNLAFDLGMLNNELRRLDKVNRFPWPRHQICTVEKSNHIKGYRLNLTRLHNLAFGKGFANAHRAKDDVFALVRCFHWLCENNHINLKDYEK